MPRSTHAMCRSRSLVATLIVISLMVLPPLVVRADALQRLSLARLAEVRQAVEDLGAQWQAVEPDERFDDVRAAMHVHSHWSHDSQASVEEVAAGANAAGVRVVMFTEHPADTYDYFVDGNRGVVDGVLMIPGAEKGGFLLFPTRSIQNESTDGPQALVDLVRRDGGQIYLSHLEERLDWEIEGLTGTEIYNTHADVKDELRFMTALRSPLSLLGLLPALNEFPQESFAAIQDYPADYLQKWDAMCAVRPHTGVAANDSHHNQGMRGIVDETGKLRIEDLLGKTLATLDPEKVALVRPLVTGRSEGDVVLELDLDPYERSLRHVSTHLLVEGALSEESVREALAAGRAYVAFGWMADPTGFRFEAGRGADRWPQGSEVVDPADLVLHTRATLPGIVKLLRDGQVVAEDRTRDFSYSVSEPGVYRAEVWLNIAGELRLWILSNPIYVRAATAGVESE